MKSDYPIRHIIIIVKENHTFDNYFGRFPGANGIKLPRASDPPAGGDLSHSHAAWLDRAKGAVREQYAESDIPAYYSYARQFTLCDNYFTDVTGPSDPNHLMLIAGASPIIDNSSASRTYQPQPPFNIPSLPASLGKAGYTWKSYGGIFNYFNTIRSLKRSRNIVPWTNFDKDVAKNKLASVSWLYAPTFPKDLTEHPPPGKNATQATVKPGMQWTVDRIRRLAKSRLWDTSAIFITWDDWGGWYDHVKPPLKDKWRGGSPKKGPVYRDTQFSYGPRVPCLVLSPYAKKGISKKFHSHVSLIKFCSKIFGLKPVNARVAASDDMMDCFDFNQKPLPPPQ